MNNSKIEPAEEGLIRDGSAVPYRLYDGIIRFFALFLTVLCCLTTVFVYFSSFGSDETISYPLEKNITQYDPYVQQFDAFMKGQLNIDYQPGEDFLAIENPYDPDQRHNVYYLYDRAYYDGKYYSYFGVAPIIFCMFPHYLIKGSLPCAEQIQLVFMIIFALFMPMSVYLIGEKVFKKVHPFMLSVVSYMAFISSLQLLIARGRTPFYYIAASSAMAFLAMFGYFFFNGLFSKKSSSACIWYLFAGLAFALCFHSRINVAFGAVFVIVPAVVFGIILKKREVYVAADEGLPVMLRLYRKYKETLFELLSLAFFVGVGFIFAFIYNKARFGSILDFGSTYQLTIADVSEYRLDLKEFGYSVFHYFLAPLRENDQTGAINFGYWRISSIERYVYVDAHFGIFAVPFSLLALITPFAVCDKKKSMLFRVTLICALVGCFVMGWIDFCLGGVIYRYLCDFSVIFATISAIGALWIFERINKVRSFPIRFICTGFLILFMLISAARVFNIMAISNGNLLEMDAESLFYRLFSTIKPE